MVRPASLTASADATREMPDSDGARLERIEAALASLENEERRLQRLGFEVPLARCHDQRRYWAFLRALFSIPKTPGVPRSGGCAWPVARNH